MGIFFAFIKRHYCYAVAFFVFILIHICMDEITFKMPAPQIIKAARGQLEYVLHRESDGSYRIVPLVAGLPEDTATLKSILNSALSKLGD